MTHFSGQPRVECLSEAIVPDLIGDTLGPYRILETIGVGGMAEVYKAYQPAMDRYVAGGQRSGPRSRVLLQARGLIVHRPCTEGDSVQAFRPAHLCPSPDPPNPHTAESPHPPWPRCRWRSAG